MGAEVHKHGKGDKREGHEPERSCAVTRAKLGPEALIRFVRSPDGVIVPDLANRLPGRGVWVAAHRDTVEAAAGRNAFARSLKSPAKIPDDLAGLVERLLQSHALSALSLANKAGLLVTGFSKVDKAIDGGDTLALVHGSDAAADGRSKLDRKFGHIASRSPAEIADFVVDCFSIEQLSLAIGRSHVVHAALTKGGAAQNFLKQAARLQRYRSQYDGAAAQPPDSGLDTEEA